MEKKNFWVIDDDPIFQMIAQKLFMQIDFCGNVETSKNGLEAADKLKEALENPTSLPDIIFLDINMPIMDGRQFLEKFTSWIDDSHPVPDIYIVTSSIDDNDKQKAADHRYIKDYIVKPVTPDFIRSLRPPEDPIVL